VGATPANSSFVLHNGTHGFTLLSYKMLGLTNNVGLTNRWSIISSNFPFTLTFDDYTLNFVSLTNIQIKRSIAGTLYYSSIITAFAYRVIIGSQSLTADTYINGFMVNLTDNLSTAGQTLNCSISDGLNKMYNILVMYITSTKLSVSVNSVMN
jgi:hypothetical protein